MSLKGDFHLHSSASDGKISPEQIVITAKNANLNYISLTDHDTISGLDEAIRIGKREGVYVIPGIELTTMHNNESIHILGYFRGDSFNSIQLIEFLESMKSHREYRAKKIVDNLKYFYNLNIDYNLVIKHANNVIARPHIAQAIIESGYNYDWDYIFNHFLNKESPAYVNNMEVSIDEGINLLHNHNALAILAHPVLIRRSAVEELLNYGFDGIEAIYYLNTTEQTQKYINLATERNIFVTAGSDFHGNLNDSSHGIIGAVYLSGELLQKFLNIFNIC